MELAEILQIEDINNKILQLKAMRKTPLPNVQQLEKDWYPSQHDVMNPDIRKKRKVCVHEEYYDNNGNKVPAEYKLEEVNRIAIPLEQDIIDTHTAFTIGKEPELSCNPNNKDEQSLLLTILAINKINKIKYHNKKLARAWFAETECVEYWYAKRDEGFWKKILAKLKSVFSLSVTPTNKLKCQLWSPFRGDTIYPFFDESNDLVAISREYTIKERFIGIGRKNTTYFQTITDTNVYVWKKENGTWSIDEKKSFRHNFEKIPCIYLYRPKSLCENIREMRNRYEKLISNYADCIDYHFFPYLILEGDLIGDNGVGNQDERRRMIKVENEGKAYYLTWSQTPESIKLEMDNLIDMIYSMTHTFRMSTKNVLEAASRAISGRAMKYTLSSMNLAVSKHAEELGEALQRRYNFLASAIGDICPKLKNASQSITIEVDIKPYEFEDFNEKVDIANKAKSAGLMSTESAIIFAGLTDHAQEELERIQKEIEENPKITEKPQDNP